MIGGLLISGDQVTAATYWPTDSWRNTTSEQQGIDSAGLADAIDLVIDTRMRLHSMLVIRHGYVVADVVFHPFTRDTKHDLASVTKPITATLIGAAIVTGKIESISQPLLDFYPDRTIANLDSRKRNINLEHLLTMTSGFTCVARPVELTLFEMLGSPDWIQFALDRPMAQAPGGGWNYDSSSIHILSDVIRRATGKQALDFGRSVLFEPLGIVDVSWPTDPMQVNNMGFGGMRMLPVDVAKIGLLYLHGGLWDGRRILSDEWCAAATGALVHSDDGMGHGYLWDSDGPVFRKTGRGGQYLYLDSERELIVVLTGGYAAFRQIVSDHIVPACRSDQPLPEAPQQAARLATVISRAERGVPVAPGEPQPMPEQMQRVAGQRFVFTPNSYWLQELTLSFTSRATAELKINFMGIDGVYKIGLDGVPRLSPGQDGIPSVAVGGWTSKDTFSLTMDEVGNINLWEMSIKFAGDEVLVDLTERGLGPPPEGQLVGRLVGD